MTNEQAVEIINNVRQNVYEDSVEDQALYMAQRALEGKDTNAPSNDAISLKQALGLALHRAWEDRGKYE